MTGSGHVQFGPGAGAYIETLIGEFHQTPRDEPAQRPVQLPPRLDVLAGRHDLLTEVHARLTGGGGPRVVALHGLGGVGKTSVAVEYAHRHLADVGVGWQFPAEDPVTLRADFARLAAVLGARDLADARDPVAVVHAVLAASAAPWLLIFDNVPDAVSMRNLAIEPVREPADAALRSRLLPAGPLHRRRRWWLVPDGAGACWLR